MSRTEPLKAYAAALEALKQGDKTGASRFLSQALGSDEVTPAIETNTRQLLDYKTPAGELALEIIRVELHRSGRAV